MPVLTLLLLLFTPATTTKAEQHIDVWRWMAEELVADQRKAQATAAAMEDAPISEDVEETRLSIIRSRISQSFAFAYENYRSNGNDFLWGISAMQLASTYRATHADGDAAYRSCEAKGWPADVECFIPEECYGEGFCISASGLDEAGKKRLRESRGKRDARVQG
jgi:hypothetical protein